MISLVDIMGRLNVVLLLNPIRLHFVDITCFLFYCMYNWTKKVCPFHSVKTVKVEHIHRLHSYRLNGNFH